MRPRSAVILAVIAVIVLGAGWYFGPQQNQAERQQANAGTLLFPGIAAPLEKASRIEIVHAGKSFAIVRAGDVWTMPSLGSYPVEATKVHALLAGLAELRVLARRTSDPHQFASLGVGDPKKPAATGTMVAVSDSADHAIASLIVGHQNYATSGQQTETLYVRQPGNDQSWLAEGKLTIESRPEQWIDDSIANIDHAEIVRVEVTRGNEKLVLAPNAGKLALLEPADHPPLGPFKVESVWRALESLSFSSVRAGPALPGKEIAQTVFTLTGGTAVTATLALDGKNLWGHFAATGTDAEAKSLAAKFGDWSYRLGDWRESALAPTLDDLLAKPPAAKK
jgi:hypothetical protein